MLDTYTTPESHIRLTHAQDIVRSCPESLFNEIALTGSSARGIASSNSDIEINFWLDHLPDIDARAAWIQSIGVEEIVVHHEPRPDNSYWINGIYKGIELEAGWQTFADLDAALNQIIKAQTTDHKALRLAELILSAKPLRGNGALDKWQSVLQNYPDDLSYKLIAETVANWLDDDWCENRLHQNSFKEDIHRVWRLIFALNQQWEINWKYAYHSLHSLDIYPKNIKQRIREIQESKPRETMIPMLQLIDDTLELIKTNLGNSQALSQNQNWISQFLLTDN